MYRVDSISAADRSIQIGPRVLESAVYAILRGAGAALLQPWKLLLKSPRHGARRWASAFSWRLAAVQYASAIGVWALVRHPFYAGVNLSSGACILLLIFAMASRGQGEIRAKAPARRHGLRTRRWKSAAFKPACGACICGARPGRLCLRAKVR